MCFTLNLIRNFNFLFLFHKKETKEYNALSSQDNGSCILPSDCHGLPLEVVAFAKILTFGSVLSSVAKLSQVRLINKGFRYLHALHPSISIISTHLHIISIISRFTQNMNGWVIMVHFVTAPPGVLSHDL